MAAVDYASIAVEVAAAFEEVRQGTVVLQRTIYAAPDPATPWIPGGETVVSYAVDAIASAVTVDQANAKYIDGTTITTADIVVTCAVPPVMPAMTDRLTVDGQARTIKKIVQVPSAGIPVMFKLFVSGSSDEADDAVTDIPLFDFSAAANSQYIALL